MKRPDIYQMIVKIAKQENYNIVPELAYAQFIHETGNFTSNVFKQGNNVCGMTAPNSRQLYIGQMPNSEGSAKYAKIEDSVLDYIRYCKQTVLGKPPVTPFSDSKQFYDEFKRRGYATDPNYSEKCQAVYSQHFPKGKTVVSNVVDVVTKIGIPFTIKAGAVVVAIIAGVFLYFKKLLPWQKH